LRRHLLDDRQNQVTLVRGRRDVEEREFVGALVVVSACDFDRVAASRNSRKFTPLTTRPAVTSRHGMMRFSESHVLANAVLLRVSAHESEAVWLTL